LSPELGFTIVSSQTEFTIVVASIRIHNVKTPIDKEPQKITVVKKFFLQKVLFPYD
jgi:hypothetical protein